MCFYICLIAVNYTVSRMYTESLITLSSISLENIPHLWKQNDILIFLIDLDNYDILSIEYLNSVEIKHLEKLQTKYFQKRYIVSRVVLKHILYRLLNTESVKDLSTYKGNYGEVRILNHEGLHICISYSENIVTLSISKVKVGIDIETKRSLTLKSSLKYLQLTSSCVDDSVNDNELLKRWTMKEAYCKFLNKPLFLIVQKDLEFGNSCYSNYLLDHKYIFSIVTDSDSYNLSISHLEKINYI